MKVTGKDNRDLTERLLKVSQEARNLTPEQRNEIIFNVGADKAGTWTNPVTGKETGINLNLEAIARDRISRAMIPDAYMKNISEFAWSIYGEDIREAKGMVNDFILLFEKLKREGMGLYIYSAVKGSGKTFLACRILWELAQRYSEYDYKFCTTSNLLALSKDFKDDGAKEKLQKFFKCSVLVLDDIGMNPATAYTNDYLFKLINDRQNEKKPTIYTSNVTPKQLKLDERIISRISANTYSVPMPEISVRDVQAEKRKWGILEKARQEKA